jgi:hypothetical protein
MSKMDGLRAMREARYAENVARAKTSAPTAKKTAAKPAATQAAAGKPPTTTTPDSVETVEPALCGHRNMSGRTCTREHGHAAKSHRYA